MGEMAAKAGDRIEGTDTHMVVIPPAPPVPIPGHDFRGTLKDNLSVDVRIDGMAAAFVDSVALNDPPHIPRGSSFAPQPTNRGHITKGSATVLINGNPAARNNDTATTCNDPPRENTGRVVVDTSTVFIGE